MGEKAATPRGLRVELPRGEQLEEPVLREMWRLRLSIMSLKPHVRPEEDFARFSQVCRQSVCTALLREAGGELRGILAMGAREGSFEGQRYRLLLPEYAFMDERQRGTARAAWGVTRLLARTWRLLPPRAAGTRVLLGGLGYPTSALMMERMLGRTWLEGEEGVPPLEAHALEWMRQQLAGEKWEEEARRVSMPTLPRAPTARWLARQQGRELYQRYLKRCPEWTQGYALPVVCELGWHTPPRLVTTLLRRAVAPRWRR